MPTVAQFAASVGHVRCPIYRYFNRLVFGGILIAQFQMREHVEATGFADMLALLLTILATG